MNGHERGADASDRAASRILKRTLRDPSVNTLLAEGCLTFLAFAWLQDDLQANLTNEERVQVRRGSIPRAQIQTDGLSLHLFTAAVLDQYEITGTQAGSISLAVVVDALTHVLEDAEIRFFFEVHVTFPELRGSGLWLSQLALALFLLHVVVLVMLMLVSHSLVLNVRVHTLYETALRAEHDALWAGGLRQDLLRRVVADDAVARLRHVA